MPLKDLLFGFEGRIRRRDWWIWSIVTGVVYLVVYDLSAALIGLDAYMITRGGQNAVLGNPVLPLTHSLVLTLAFLWPQTALAAKRAHDRADSAWLAVIATIASSALSYWPFETYALSGSALDNGDLFGGAGLISGLIILAVSLYLLVVLGFLDGTRGPNRFGRSPKGIGGDPADTAAAVFD